MLDDAFVLRYRARSQRYLINVRCPKPEEAEGFMRSGAEPEWPEEMKAQHRRNSRCNLLKNHRYLRPIMQPSDSTRKKTARSA